MIEGWICLHRQILDSEVFTHQVALKIWIWCLCKAAHNKKSVPFRSGESTTTVKLDKGQFIFGRHKAEEELFIDGSTIYKWMKKFSEEWNMIKIESNNKYSIITILNFSKFQENLIKTKRKKNSRVTTEEQQSSSRVAAEEQQSNTNNNVNNYNNIIYSADADVHQRAEEFIKNLLPHVEKFGQATIDDFFGYWTETDKSGKKMRFEGEKFFNISRRLGTWKKKEGNHFTKKGNPNKLVV